ncbi:hypothetical protein AGMMS50276_02290 [Synergistales bacterium]|nr:hypothetical protein AGMMS50276_02290 [Synergistales bacterium]
MKKILLLFSAIFIFSVCVFGYAHKAHSASDIENLPDTAKITADMMRFDSKTGNFSAEGNVIIQADGLTVVAPRGEGNITSKEVHFSEGIVASGDWQGDWVEIAAGNISLYLAQLPTYTVENNVKGQVGRIYVDADKFYIKGEDFSAKNVRRLEDYATSVVFGADTAYGKLADGALTELTAEKKVWLKGRPNFEGEMIDVKSDAAYYSALRGSVVLTGGVKAVQKGRTLDSHSVVYFPVTNVIEAIGDRRNEAGGDTGRARITIDMSQEKANREKKRKQDP